MFTIAVMSLGLFVGLGADAIVGIRSSGLEDERDRLLIQIDDLSVQIDVIVSERDELLQANEDYEESLRSLREYIEIADWLVEHIRWMFGDDLQLATQPMNTGLFGMVRRKALNTNDDGLMQIISQSKTEGTVLYPDSWISLMDYVMLRMEQEVGSDIRNVDPDALGVLN